MYTLLTYTYNTPRCTGIKIGSLIDEGCGFAFTVLIIFFLFCWWSQLRSPQSMACKLSPSVHTATHTHTHTHTHTLYTFHYNTTTQTRAHSHLKHTHTHTHIHTLTNTHHTHTHTHTNTQTHTHTHRPHNTHTHTAHPHLLQHTGADHHVGKVLHLLLAHHIKKGQ